MTTVVQNAIDAISLGSLYALVALGIALIFGIMQLVNFAYGELIMVGGYAIYYLAGKGWIPLIVGAVAAAAAVALIMERVAFRPVRGASPATLLVTSFAVSYFLQNLVILVISPQPKGVAISPVVIQQFSVGSFKISKLDVITLAASFALLGALALFLKKTRLGVQMRAAAEDFRMAQFLGVRANVVIAAAFAISGMLAGAVAILFISQLGTVTPQIGLAPLLAGVVAAVIGGMVSLPGAVLGGYVLGILTIALDAGLPSGLRVFRDAFVFSIVILILLFKPQGIITSRITKVRA